MRLDSWHNTVSSTRYEKLHADLKAMEHGAICRSKSRNRKHEEADHGVQYSGHNVDTFKPGIDARIANLTALISDT